MATLAVPQSLRIEGSWVTASLAACVLVRPLELHRVIPQFLGLPGADIADLAVRVVVPPLARYRIGDRFAKLMRTGGG